MALSRGGLGEGGDDDVAAAGGWAADDFEGGAGDVEMVSDAARAGVLADADDAARDDTGGGVDAANAELGAARPVLVAVRADGDDRDVFGVVNTVAVAAQR